MSVLSRVHGIFSVLNLEECNGNYERLVIERIENLAKIKSCDLLDLSLGEVLSCVEAAYLDFNELSPILFPGHKPRTEAEVRACFAERLQ
ncbi:hypothetical protein [Cellvibrio mixtus]|uniref:hypothetical protein n=1 Tax=Cellvibrio mixtus TaxID=39650 RepID=UPI000586F268|nr:hypothetical protein [Cellvibrio mixtus]